MATSSGGGIAAVLDAVRFDLADLSAVRREVKRRLLLFGVACAQTDDFVVAVSEVPTKPGRAWRGIGMVELGRADGHVRCVVRDRGRVCRTMSSAPAVPMQAPGAAGWPVGTTAILATNLAIQRQT
jgi:hypothetical protein